MSPPTEVLQRISHLTPLGDLVAWIDQEVRLVSAKELDVTAAVGAILGADVVATDAVPPVAVAMRDGWAVASEAVSDAGPYAPTPLASPPAWIETGQGMPPGTDAVLPLDAVTIARSGAEAHASAASGEGVSLVGTDAPAGAVLLRAGERVRPSDAAALRAARVGNVVMRAPRIMIFSASVPTRSAGDSISPLIARAAEAEGGIPQVAQAASLDSALLDRASDAVVTIGGTGTGRRDASVKTLARVGKVAFHGLGIAPGETGALGLAGTRPVLMLPGRLDAALAVFLVLGRRMIARLAGRNADDQEVKVTLTKKVTSTIGLAEVVLVRRAADGVEPLASGTFPLAALAQADGWILVPPASEGLPAGATATLRILP